MKDIKDLDFILDCQSVKIEAYGDKTRLIISKITDDEITDAIVERQLMLQRIKTN